MLIWSRELISETKFNVNHMLALTYYLMETSLNGERNHLSDTSKIDSKSTTVNVFIFMSLFVTKD